MSDHGQGQMNAANNSPDWEAIARVLASESSEEEANRVRAWLASHPADRQLVERLDETARPELADVDVETALQRLHRRMETGAAPKLTLVRGNKQKPRQIIAL